jgi:acetolactate synthase I/II/III large subunit
MPRKLPEIDRRKFLKGVAVGGAAVGLAGSAEAQTGAPAAAGRSLAKAPLPSAAMRAAEEKVPAEVEKLTTQKTGSDFMVDVVKTLGIDYLAACPGSTFRALQESFINYGANKQPEWLTCLHEEASVAMAHGYSKIAGKPMAAMVHGTVGLQHASMAIYNAWCDRAPVIVFTASAGATDDRRPGVEWAHSVQDGASLVRDFSKWDDMPWSLQHFAESMVRAYKVATTAPTAPVVIVAEGKLQEAPLHADEAKKLTIPKLVPNTQPQGDLNAVRETAQLLVAAENPLIVADRYARTPEAIPLLIKLAELLQAPVVDLRARMNFPNQHPLNHSDRFRALLSQADVMLALEPVDLYGEINGMRDQIERTSRKITKPGAKIVTIGSNDLLIHANYQDFQRFETQDISISGDAEATMPSLIEAVQRALTDNRKSALAARGQKLAEAKKESTERLRGEAAYAWDASPLSLARLSMELWAQIKGEDWSLVSSGGGGGGWPFRLWNFDKAYHHIGGSGGSGMGYGLPASVGAALANKERGRLSVSIQTDGDFMISPGAMWTMAHHQIPMLVVMNNNRAYHQEVMHIQRMANRHNRGVDRAWIGTTIRDPNIDYGQLARSMGVFGEGPITDPKDLGPAIKKALEVVKRGEPALVDVYTQPR